MSSDMSSNAINKKALRQHLRQERRKLNLFQQHRAAKRLLLQLNQTHWFRNSQNVALYLASDGELDCKCAIEYLLQRGISVFLPVLHPIRFHHLLFVRYDAHTHMRFNRFGIQEPKLHRPRLKPMHAMDSICLPLVGFDDLGNRLGMGGGFYDRSLEKTRCRWIKTPRLIGLAHELQHCGTLPNEPWDIRVSAVITDQGHRKADR